PRSGWREFFLKRVGQVIEAGADGVFIDVAFMPGLEQLIEPYLGEAHGHVAGSYDAAMLAAFHAASPDAKPPSLANYLSWDDPDWQGWLRFRYETIRDYYAAIDAAVRAKNSDG